MNGMEWIKVVDRLPEHYGDTLTYNKSGFMHVCCFHPTSKKFTRKDGRPIWDHLTITHWMKLPEPPSSKPPVSAK